MQAPNIDFHEWELRLIYISGLALIALTVLSELIDKARVIYIKIQNFRKPDDPPKSKSAPS